MGTRAVDTNEETIFPEGREAPKEIDAELVSEEEVEIEASDAVDAVEVEENETETEITAADETADEDDSSPSKGAEKRIAEITKARREAAVLGAKIVADGTVKVRDDSPVKAVLPGKKNREESADNALKPSTAKGSAGS